MENIKTKSAAKVVLPKSPLLEKKILDTMATISQIVGGTLGPGGRPVIIERQEYNLPPLCTKDGVTVFRSLGFQDAIQHSILESIRDVSVRTAQEAGDGTTTATILSEAFVRHTSEFCKKNPTIPSIFVIKTIQRLFREVMVPTIEKLTIKCDFETPKGKRLLRNVAKISGNGDTDLADAVMQCFDITGDEGNVTIIESTGKTSYEVEKIEGYPVLTGYESACGKFYSAFINDPATQRIIMDKPIFILYFGRISDFHTCLDILERLQEGLERHYLETPNIVLMATGFSESVLANLASIFVKASNINVLPVLIPKTAVLNSEYHFLEDIAAVTGAEIFDPTTKQLNTAVFEDLGNLAKEEQIIDGTPTEVYVPLGVKSFECGRYRSTVIGHCDEEILIKQIDKVKSAIPNTESEYDLRYFQERLAKLSGGIAKLKVIGSSNGELKERRDRAEDAVCAVRAAIKNGALIGGGWTLTKIAMELSNAETDETCKAIVDQIINPSILSVLRVLFTNAGMDETSQPKEVIDSIKKGNTEKAMVVDISTGQAVNALKEGILDSVPALEEALRNSIAGATLLGTVGGCVVFPRDNVAEIAEARDANEFARMAASGIENERG
jgi:chaperonin GroEL